MEKRCKSKETVLDNDETINILDNSKEEEQQIISMDKSTESNRSKIKKYSAKTQRLFVLLGTLLCVTVAVICWYFLYDHNNDSTPNINDSTPHFNDSKPNITINEYYEQKFIDIPSNDSCYETSKQFASSPHVAGMTTELQIGSLFVEIMEDLGYESIRDNISSVVLDHYNSSQLFINGKEIDLSQPAIPSDPETNTSFRKRSWIAFSASGDHTAPLLYINSGNDRDYEFLINNLSIDLNGSDVGYIGLVKRGNVVRQTLRAGYYGLKGLILFENNYGTDASVQYPNGPEKPNFGFRIDGNARFGVGCPGNLNPQRVEDECGFDTADWDDLFPAIEYNLSMIIISPNTAIQLFELMHNNFYNESKCDTISNNSRWQTQLPIDVCIGGTNNVLARIITSNDMHLNDTIQNVYGYIEGDTYPNEIIMLGAHRDAWGFGACDDISGTVTMLEIARSLSVLMNEYDWYPKRSIMFASWDAEEWGLYGSTNFNEKNNYWLNKIIAYLNFDMTVVGGSLRINGNPLLRKLLLNTAKQVQYPYTDDIIQNNRNNSTNFTLYDTWWNFEEDAANNLPLIGCNSDYCPFEYYSGIPVMGANFWAGANAYTYHTLYDLNGWLSIIDPKWDFAKAMAQYGGLLTLKLAQEDLIPFDVQRLALKMSEWAEIDLVNQMDKYPNCSVIFQYYDSLIDAVDKFQSAANMFDDYYQKILDIIDDKNEDSREDVNKINYILSNIMRKLTLRYPEGIPSNKWFKQLIWSSGRKRFPYIWDNLDHECNETELMQSFEITVTAINEVSDLMMSVESGN